MLRQGTAPISSLYGKLAVPVAILLLGLIIQGIVLPIILLVVWFQRRKLAPNFQPPWEDPDKAGPLLERLRTRLAARPDGPQAQFARWLDAPPYGDRAAFKEWMRRRLATAVLMLLGLALILRTLALLSAKLPAGSTTSI